MALFTDISADLKSAMLSREAETVSVLRLLVSELKYAQIKKGSDLTDEEIMQSIRREVKKRDEAALLYRSEKHEDRATQEESEALILKKYLPAALDPQVITAFIQSQIEEIGSTPAVRGALIKATMNHFGNQVDGKVVSGIVGQLLQ